MLQRLHLLLLYLLIISIVASSVVEHQGKVHRFIRPGVAAIHRSRNGAFIQTGISSRGLHHQPLASSQHTTPKRWYAAAAASKRREGKGQHKDESLPLEWYGKSVEDLKAISSYFPEMKDNSTFFFYAPHDYDTFQGALADAMPNIDLERATKLHEIGAVYIHRDKKFRRTHRLEMTHPESTKVAKDELFRVYMYPR